MSPKTFASSLFPSSVCLSKARTEQSRNHERRKSEKMIIRGDVDSLPSAEKVDRRKQHLWMSRIIALHGPLFRSSSLSLSNSNLRRKTAATYKVDQ